MALTILSNNNQLVQIPRQVASWSVTEPGAVGGRQPPLLAPDIWLADAADLPADAAWEDRWGPCSAVVAQSALRTRICSRRLLESVLPAYLAPAECSPCILRDEYGRPHLADAELDFNLSHSGDKVLLAIHGVGPVGIDLEKIRPGRDWLAIAGRFFSPQEARCLSGLTQDPTLLAERFHLLWTAKEAALKAVGFGIANGLGQTTVQCGADGDSKVFPPGSAGMRLLTFLAAPDYPAAVAWSGPAGAKPAFLRWTPSGSGRPLPIQKTHR